MKKEYGKLVRDRIPEIIEADGKSCQVKTIDNKESLKAYLSTKLLEEMSELILSRNAQEAKGEIADLLEVLETYALMNGLSMDEVLEAKEKKKAERGGFEKGLVLVEVDDGK